MKQEELESDFFFPATRNMRDGEETSFAYVRPFRNLQRQVVRCQTLEQVSGDANALNAYPHTPPAGDFPGSAHTRFRGIELESGCPKSWNHAPVEFLLGFQTE